MTSSIASTSPKYDFCDEITNVAKLVRYFFIISVCPKLRSNFGNHTCLERIKKILCISKTFLSRGGCMEISTMRGVHKFQYFS